MPAVQDILPISELHEDGLMRCGADWSVCYELGDTNYEATSEVNQAQIMLRYEELIKSMACDVDMKVVMENRALGDRAVRDAVTVPVCGDSLDVMRRELTAIGWQRAHKGAQAMRRMRCVTLTRSFARRRDTEGFFARAGDTLTAGVKAIGAAARRLTGKERLWQLRHFFRPQMDEWSIADFASVAAHCGRVTDAVFPDSLVLHPGYVEMDGRFARTLILRDYPGRMDDTLLADMMDMPRELLCAVDYSAKGKEEALRILNRHKDKVEADIRKRTVTSGREGNWNASIPRHLEEEREALAQFFECISQQDQRIVMAQVLLTHIADSLSELNQDTAAIRAAAAAKGADMAVLMHRQEQGLATVLPAGPDMVGQRRMISSENASFFIPFRTKEIFEPGGIVYGVNEISQNLVMTNRMHYKNGNGFIVGDAGGGKSVLAKYEMMSVMLTTNDDLIVLDPDGEYGRIVRWLGGEVVRLAADSPDTINLMDLPDALVPGDDPVTLKCALISGAADLMMRGAMNGAERSVVDRCVRSVLMHHAALGGRPPVLADVYECLRAQPEPAARDVALAMEIYAKGSLSVFSRPTSVNVSGRLICFDELPIVLPCGNARAAAA